ncbi:MAG: ChbG/HpnK family deacetylase [Phascolarctobacterium sp.]
MTKLKRLIVNADDFGLHTLINQGIIKGHREGFITSTSIMPSANAYEEAVALAKENPQLGIGIHLTLVGGVKSVLPKSKVSSLVDAQGLFLPDYVAFAKRLYTGGVKASELEAELRAQIEKALASGLNITHIDSHQHTHVLPGINGLVRKLCNEYNIKRERIPKEGYTFTGGFQAGFGRKIGRAGLSFCADLAAISANSSGIKHPDYFFGMLAGGHLTAELVGNIIRQLPEGVSEIMTHPGLKTAPLAKLFDWTYTWETELESYLSEENKELLKQYNVQLINFGDL